MAEVIEQAVRDGASLKGFPLRDRVVPPHPNETGIPYDSDGPWQQGHEAHYDARRHNIDAQFNRKMIQGGGAFLLVMATFVSYLVYQEDIEGYAEAFSEGYRQGIEGR